MARPGSRRATLTIGVPDLSRRLLSRGVPRGHGSRRARGQVRRRRGHRSVLQGNERSATCRSGHRCRPRPPRTGRSTSTRVTRSDPGRRRRPHWPALSARLVPAGRCRTSPALGDVVNTPPTRECRRRRRASCRPTRPTKPASTSPASSVRAGRPRAHTGDRGHVSCRCARRDGAGHATLEATASDVPAGARRRRVADPRRRRGLSVVEWLRSAAPPSIIPVHGLASNARTWDGVAAELRALGRPASPSTSAVTAARTSRTTAMPSPRSPTTSSSSSPGSGWSGRSSPGSRGAATSWSMAATRGRRLVAARRRWSTAAGSIWLLSSRHWEACARPRSRPPALDRDAGRQLSRQHSAPATRTGPIEASPAPSPTCEVRADGTVAPWLTRARAHGHRCAASGSMSRRGPICAPDHRAGPRCSPANVRATRGPSCQRRARCEARSRHSRTAACVVRRC